MSSVYGVGDENKLIIRTAEGLRSRRRPLSRQGSWHSMQPKPPKEFRDNPTRRHPSPTCQVDTPEGQFPAAMWAPLLFVRTPSSQMGLPVIALIQWSFSFTTRAGSPGQCRSLHHPASLEYPEQSRALLDTKADSPTWTISYLHQQDKCQKSCCRCARTEPLYHIRHALPMLPAIDF